MTRQKPFRIFHVAAALLLLGCASVHAQGLQEPLHGRVVGSGKQAGETASAPQNDTMKASIRQASQKKKIGVVIFPDFETLDVFGPVQMWGRLDDYEVVMVSQYGGPVLSAQGVETPARYSFENAPQFEVIMVPGGLGTRTEVNNPAILAFLRRQDRGTEWTTSVSQGSNVLWQGRARWVVDGKYVTSSGVSAGTDMALGLVEKLYGRARADLTARDAEYIWNDDPSNDPFAVE